MIVEIDGVGKKEIKKNNIKAIELLKELNINPNTVVLIKNNEIITEDEILKESDNIKIISVVSGG